MKRRLSLAWPLTAAFGLSCSVLVAGEPQPLRCSLEGALGPPACDSGQICRLGVCQSPSGAGGEGGIVGTAGAGADGGGAAGEGGVRH